MTVELSSALRQALGSLVSSLANEGFRPIAAEESASFGNFYVTFSNGERSFGVARDRGQFIVTGAERAALAAAGVWRTFSGAQQLTPLLVKWARES